MKTDVLLFGQARDIVGWNSISVNDVADTAELVKVLTNDYPALKDIPFVVAVDRQIKQENTLLNEHAVVAILPPFSGG